MFTGPIKQIRTVKEYKYEIEYLRYLVKADRDLRLQLQSHIDYIVKQKHDGLLSSCQDRIITLGNTNDSRASTEAIIPPPSSLTKQQPLSTKIEDEITAALALDLFIIPRPSRSDSTVHPHQFKKIYSTSH